MPEALLTQTMVDEALGRLRDSFRERMQRDADNLLRVASSYTDELLLAAYMDGVRDGFVQGAEAKRCDAVNVERERAARSERYLGVIDEALARTLVMVRDGHLDEIDKSVRWMRDMCKEALA